MDFCICLLSRWVSSTQAWAVKISQDRKVRKSGIRYAPGWGKAEKGFPILQDHFCLSHRRAILQPPRNQTFKLVYKGQIRKRKSLKFFRWLRKIRVPSKIIAYLLRDGWKHKQLCLAPPDLYSWSLWDSWLPSNNALPICMDAQLT